MVANATKNATLIKRDMARFHRFFLIPKSMKVIAEKVQRFLKPLGKNNCSLTVVVKRNLPLFLALVPSNHRIGLAIGRGEIRLDVEKRRAIEAIEADDRKFIIGDA